VAEVGQADGMGEAEVSGPDDGDPRQLALLLVDVPVDSYPPVTLGADVTVAGILLLNETAVTRDYRIKLLASNITLADPVPGGASRFGRLYASNQGGRCSP